MKIICFFSGGKDSQACLIKACQDFGNENVTAVFCDTGWEHELTYEHVEYVAKFLSVDLKVIKNEKIGSFPNLCKKMMWFPDSLHRICTVQLKIQPAIDYILTIDDDVLVIQGIRAAESSARAKLACSGDYFSEYFESNNESKGRKKLYRKSDVLKWAKSHRAIVERPFFGASGQDVIDFILNNGMQVNPLYKRGASRVGCFPCIYSKLSEIKIVAQDMPYAHRLEELEKEVNLLKAEANFSPATFFCKGKIPARFCKVYGGSIATAKEVFRYVLRDDEQLDLFEDKTSFSCMSIYHGLCE